MTGWGGGPKFVYPEFTARPLQTESFNKKLAKLAKKFSRTMIIGNWRGNKLKFIHLTLILSSGQSLVSLENWKKLARSADFRRVEEIIWKLSSLIFSGINVYQQKVKWFDSKSAFIFLHVVKNIKIVILTYNKHMQWNSWWPNFYWHTKLVPKSVKPWLKTRGGAVALDPPPCPPSSLLKEHEWGKTGLKMLLRGSIVQNFLNQG